MIFTFVCHFSRPEYLEDWLSMFEALNLPKQYFVFTVDAEEPGIMKARLKEWCQTHAIDWRILANKYVPHPKNVEQRRKRIAFLKNQTRSAVSEFPPLVVIGLEDDTVFNSNLLQLPEQLGGNIGYIEGVACGRWGYKMIGAWLADNCKNPETIKTLLPAYGTQEITGGGFYGYATFKTLYCEYEYTDKGKPWGPDVEYGFWLNKKGYKCLIDWDVEFGHRTEHGVLWPDDEVVSVRYNNIGKGDWILESTSSNRMC